MSLLDSRESFVSLFPRKRILLNINKGLHEPFVARAPFVETRSGDARKWGHQPWGLSLREHKKGFLFIFICQWTLHQNHFDG